MVVTVLSSMSAIKLMAMVTKMWTKGHVQMALAPTLLAVVLLSYERAGKFVWESLLVSWVVLSLSLPNPLRRLLLFRVLLYPFSYPMNSHA